MGQLIGDARFARPWAIDPAPKIRDGVLFQCGRCIGCFRLTRWEPLECYECNQRTLAGEANAAEVYDLEDQGKCLIHKVERVRDGPDKMKCPLCKQASSRAYEVRRKEALRDANQAAA